MAVRDGTRAAALASAVARTVSAGLAGRVVATPIARAGIIIRSLARRCLIRRVDGFGLDQLDGDRVSECADRRRQGIIAGRDLLGNLEDGTAPDTSWVMGAPRETEGS
jgi:hypothetical protein